MGSAHNGTSRKNDECGKAEACQILKLKCTDRAISPGGKGSKVRDQLIHHIRPFQDHLFAVRLFTARDIRSRTFQKRMQAAHRERQRTAAQSLLPFGRKRCDSGDRSRSHRCSAQKLRFHFFSPLHIRFMIFIKACRLLPDRRQTSQLRRFSPRAAHSAQTPSSAAAVDQNARSG